MRKVSRTCRVLRQAAGGWLCMAMLNACSAREQAPPPPPPAPVVQAATAPFSISLVPTVPVPIRIGTSLGFNVSANTAGYASLYLIDPAGRVTVLGENMVVSAARDLVYPAAVDGFTVAAAEPVGFNQVILLVTRQPFAGGFSGVETLTTPVSLALGSGEFRRQLNRRTGMIPRTAWAMDEIRVRVVG